MNRVISKYLESYAEKEACGENLLKLFGHRGPYKDVLVVPAYQEDSAFIPSLLKHCTFENLLLIVIANCPDNATPTAQLATAKMWQDLTLRYHKISTGEQSLLLGLEDQSGNVDCLLIDRIKHGALIPAMQGVGLARKIGADIALTLRQAGILQSDWIALSDADATLPPDYFSKILSCQGVAAHFAFRHVNPDGVSLAQQLYDLSLDYYVQGLKFAGSKFAHHSLGSAIVVNALAYAQVRGFPKRSAGEDFHLLNKLAKIGEIEYFADSVIEIAERDSLRVPFGTGPAVHKIRSLEKPVQEYRYYHPDSFSCLKRLLDFIEYSYPEKAAILHSGLDQYLQNLWRLELHTQQLLDGLRELGFIQIIEKTLMKEHREQQYLHQIRNRIDGLQTLRLIHYLQKHALGTVQAAQAQAWLATVSDKPLTAIA